MSSKKPTKFGPFRKFFQRSRQTINPSDFIFQRAPTKKLRVRIPAILRGGADKKWNVPFDFRVYLQKSKDSKAERLFHRFEDLDVHFFGGRVFCRVFSFHLEFHKGVFIVKGVNEHIENFNSEPCGHHLLFSKERETGDQFGRTIQPKYGVFTYTQMWLKKSPLR